MVGLDTNILARHLIGDAPEQAAKATALIERLTPQAPGYISLVAIAELVWVMRRIYRFEPAAIASGVERLLATSSLYIQDSASVFTAAAALRRGEADFADALIAALSEAAGCSTTYTFDRGALRLPGFTAL